MQIIANVFGTILRFIYENISHVMGEPKSISYFAISILLLTLIYKLITLPVTIHTQKTQEQNALMQPEIKEIQRKYKNNPQTQQLKMQELYKKYNFNPLSGCLPIILQMVLVLALFRVMREPGKYMFDNVSKINEIARNFFWIPDLTKPDPVLFGLPLINAFTQFLVAKISMPTNNKDKKSNEPDQMEMMNKSMIYFMPIFMFFISSKYASGLILYWGFSNVIEVLIRLIIKNKDKKDVAEEVRWEAQ